MTEKAAIAQRDVDSIFTGFEQRMAVLKAPLTNEGWKEGAFDARDLGKDSHADTLSQQDEEESTGSEEDVESPAWRRTTKLLRVQRRPRNPTLMYR